MRKHFDEQLQTLLHHLLAMAASCKDMLAQSVEALASQQPSAIESVIRADDSVDALEQQIEKEAILLLTLQQPVVASDLRFVIMVLKAVTDVERIGDHCVNIAKVGGKMAAAQMIYEPLVDVRRMERLVAVMLEDTVRAIVKRDVALAQSVIRADDEVDVLYQEMQRDLYEQIQQGQPGIVARTSYLLFVLHYLERIGDHCVGINERLLYFMTGAMSVLDAYQHDPYTIDDGAGSDVEVSEKVEPLR